MSDLNPQELIKKKTNKNSNPNLGNHFYWEIVKVQWSDIFEPYI